MQVRNRIDAGPSKPSRRIATLLVGFIALSSPLLVIAPAAQAAPIPTDRASSIGGRTDATPKDKVYRGYISCSGTPATWCWGSVFYQVGSCTTGQYGCFYMSGKYWRLRNTSVNYDNSAQQSCVMGLVGAAYGFFTGPWFVRIAGGVAAVLGCQGVPLKWSAVRR